MDDMLRQIYDGDYIASELVSVDKNRIMQDEEMKDQLHEKILQALVEKYGQKEATKIDDRYEDAYSSIINEEMISAFKEGFRLGVGLIIRGLSK